MNSLYHNNPKKFLSTLQNHIADMIFLDLSKSNEINHVSLIQQALAVAKPSCPVVVLSLQSQNNRLLLSSFAEILRGYHCISVKNTNSLTAYDMFVFSAEPYCDNASLKSLYSFRTEKQIDIQQKPYMFYQDIIESYSRPKDLIIDPLMGRGCFLSAAVKNDRVYLGCEQESINYMIATNLITSAEIKCHRLSNLNYFPMYRAM